MKRVLLAALFCLIASTLSAQTLNLTAKTAANPNPGQTVTGYKAYVDALPAVSLPATLDPSCSCVSFDFAVNTTGGHTIKFTAVNVDSLGTPQESGPLTQAFTVASLVIVPPPGTPAGPIQVIVKP